MVEAVQNRSLTMSDLTTAASSSYARNRAELERQPRAITFGEASDDLIFEAEVSPFPWWVPEGVSWLDYLFGTYIRMRIAVFPQLPGRCGFDDHTVSLAVGENELTEEQREQAGPLLRLMREVKSRRDEAMEAACLKVSMVGG